MSSGGRISQNSQRHNRKSRRDVSPSTKSKDKSDTRRGGSRTEHERYRSETDLSKQDDADKDRDKKYRDKNNLSSKNKSRNRSPRRSKDNFSERKFTTQKREIKVKNDSKDKVKEKKSPELTGLTILKSIVYEKKLKIEISQEQEVLF